VTFLITTVLVFPANGGGERGFVRVLNHAATTIAKGERSSEADRTAQFPKQAKDPSSCPELHRSSKRSKTLKPWNV